MGAAPRIARNATGNRSRRRRGGGYERPKRGQFLLYFLIYVIVCEEIQEALASRDLYETLGVARDADVSTIKKAYRKLAMKFHPDKNPGDKTAAKMYVELNNAYEVLSDDSKRQRYDMTGAMDGGGEGDDDDGWDPWGIFRPRRRQREEKRVPDLVIPLAVDLELLYTGGLVDMVHRRQILCDSWSDCEKRCHKCGGQGIVITTRRLGPGFVQQMQTTCPVCGGTGKIGVRNCKSCPNGQFEKEEKALTLDIERGVPDGHRITEGQTDELPDHLPGDVHFQLHTRPHARFERDGNDLHYEQEITLAEALTGVDRKVKQLDGRDIEIKTDQVVAPNDELRIAGEGMPIYDGSGAGDMIVKFWVKFPKTLTADQKELARKMLGDTVPTDDSEKVEL